MSYSSFINKPTASAYKAIFTLLLVAQTLFPCPVLAVSSQTINSSENFSQQYSAVTKKILLSGIELERFSLNFRLENARQPKFRKLRFFLAQETGASCGLAYEIVGINQTNKGKRRPLKIGKSALQGGLATAMVGSIIAATGSTIELGSNLNQQRQARQHGYDEKSANKFVKDKLKQIDELIAQREALVTANESVAGHERAEIEGSVLRAMRNSFINEYSHFNADIRGNLAFQDLFFFLNASYNALGAVAAGVAYEGVSKPKLNGTANILFIVSGGMASVSPLLSSAASKIARKSAFNSLNKELNEKPQFDASAFAAQCKKLEETAGTDSGSLIPSLPATQRLALYTESDDLFRKQLDSETKTMRKLDKIALETSVLGPAIGAQLMTQGILGTVGYYRYATQPRKQISEFFRGSVVGAVGTSMAVVGNAAWLLSSMSYEHRLAREKRLPEQLIKSRLEHLAELEKTISAI